MKNTEAATFLVLIGVGSRHENRKINGVSHFLEHMVFKGTKDRPKPGQVHKELDRIGASHNAFTSKEYTGFWVKSNAQDFDTGIDIVSDIVLNPLFKEEEIEKERTVILQEINMYEDVPQRKVWNVLEGVIFGDQPIGWDVAGTKESVGQIKKSDILNYRQDNYLAKNMIVVLAGDIDTAKTFKKVSRLFEKIKKEKNKDAEKFVSFQKQPQVRIIKKETDQTHLAMAIGAYDKHDEKRYALNLLGVILGGNTSSRLFAEIREKLGLAYYILAAGEQYGDCGYLGLAAGVGPGQFERVVKKISEMLKKIKQSGVSENELAFAKSYIRGQTALSLETSDEVANFCAEQELFYGKILQPEEILSKIEKVSKNDILKVAKDVLTPGRINLAAIGKGETKEEFHKKLFLTYLK